MNNLIAQIIYYIQQAGLNLQVAKLRTFLAVLGLLVGAASIVALISCSLLATEKALAQFKAFGTNLVGLSVTAPESAEAHTDTAHLSLQAWKRLPLMIERVQEIAPYAIAHPHVSFQGNLLNPSIIGADPDLATMLHISVEQGRFVSFFETYERVCVIGNKLAYELQQISMDNPLGTQIRIGDTLYTIIGVSSAWKGNGIFYEDINTAIIIPIRGMAALNQQNTINNAVLSLSSENHIDDTIAQIIQIIHIQTPHVTIFARSAKQIIAGVEKQGKIFTLLLAVIGSIALLVGGIGVMNVMLISVSERKKEIGIRKALGAKKQAIQTLFLTESIILSLLGGGFGIVTGLVLTLIIAYFSHWPFIIYWSPLLIGFSVSIGAGIFFGFYPAYRAAQLAPLAALRSD